MNTVVHRPLAIHIPRTGIPELDNYPRIPDLKGSGAVRGFTEHMRRLREAGLNVSPVIMGGAADAWKFYDIARERMADGGYDLDDDSFKIALFLSASDAATLTTGNSNLADLSNQHANGNGYTTGGIALTTTWVASTATLTFDYTNSPVWTASGGSIVARFAVIYDDTHGSNGLLCMTTMDNAPADVTATTGNTLTVDANSSGVFTLTGAT